MAQIPSTAPAASDKPAGNGTAQPAASGTQAGTPAKPVVTGTAATGQATAAKAAAAPTNKPPAGPAFKIESIGNRLRYIKMLVYGDYGVGKTYLCGTSCLVPSMEDILLINAESGDLTLYDPDGKIPFDKIDTVRVKDYRTIARVYDFLRAHCALRDQEGEEAEKKLLEHQSKFFADTLPDPHRVRRYRTVIGDSLTEFEVYCMNQLLGIADNTRMDEEIQGAEWSEYKKQHQMVQRMIRNFRDLPMHVLFTAARSYVQDETKRMIFSPAMTGKLSSQVQGFMDVVGYLQAGTAAEPDQLPPRRLSVQPGRNFAAKCRFSAYKKPHFENPTMKSILEQVGLIEKAVPAKPATTGGK